MSMLLVAPNKSIDTNPHHYKASYMHMTIASLRVVWSILLDTANPTNNFLINDMFDEVDLEIDMRRETYMQEEFERSMR